ncbi:hypothetical protein [Bacillus sp. AFS040349]|uniref:hypothetical protein n=1 Tax=Bacillus sp. AFS040349 TaxID=2033502 RepID=UPI000BFCC899|nr:hypothetical protein [Bacillus sp. AFS040349]PGT80585.1 hypothetical protein COD11_20965 [Bacillus sp. AFS040349]
MRYPTDKQLNLIAKMELLIDVKFVGSTISDASRFISEHMDQYKEVQELAFDMMYYHDAY